MKIKRLEPFKILTSSFVALILCFVGCASPQLQKPLGGASTLKIDSSLTLQERVDLLEERALGITTRTIITKGGGGGGSIEIDQTRLTQGDQTYVMSAYLPVLHSEGIATEVEDPWPYRQRQNMVTWAWTGAGVAAGYFLGAQQEDELVGVGYFMLASAVGFLGANIHGDFISLPAQKIEKTVMRKRVGWIKDYNQSLIDKLQLENKGPTITALPLVTEDKTKKKKRKSRKRKPRKRRGTKR